MMPYIFLRVKFPLGYEGKQKEMDGNVGFLNKIQYPGAWHLPPFTRAGAGRPPALNSICPGP